MKLRPVMHLDGCHYSVTLGKVHGGELVLIFTERTGEDFDLWAKPETCSRCARLLLGAEPRTVMQRDVDVPELDGAGAMLVTVTGMANDIDKAKT